MEEKECRICFENDNIKEFINPCLCNGTSKWIHYSCLNEWRETNIGKPANTNCMECKYKYKFSFIYPEESMLLKKSVFYKYKFNYWISLNLILIPFGYLFYYMDLNNNYLYLRMMSGGNNKILNETKYLINNDTFFKSIIYNTLALTIYANVYLFSFFLYTLMKKKRKKLYLRKIYKNFFNALVLINNPFYIYHLLSFLQFFYTYLFFQVIFSFHSIYITSNIIKIHNKIVHKMNTKFNTKLILNYENESKSQDLLIDENIMLQRIA